MSTKVTCHVRDSVRFRNKSLYPRALRALGPHYLFQQRTSRTVGALLTQYITNAGISHAKYTITHFKHQHRVLRLISNRMSVNIAIIAQFTYAPREVKNRDLAFFFFFFLLILLQKVGMLMQKITDTRGLGISNMRTSKYLLTTTPIDSTHSH